MEFAKHTVKQFSGHRKKVLDVNWNSDGTKLVSGSADNSIRVWQLEPSGLEKQQEYKSHRDQVDQVQFHPEDPNIFVSASSDKFIKIFDIRQAQPIRSTETKGANINLSFRPDGQMLAVGKQDNKVNFYDFKMMMAGQQQKEGKVNEMQWDRSSSVLFVTSGTESNKSTNSGQIYVLDGHSPRLPYLQCLPCHLGTSYCLSVSPDNKYFATGGSDALIAIWDLREMVCIQTYTGVEEQVRKLGFSWNSQYLASASEDSKIAIIAVEDGQMVQEIECNAAQNTVSWHPSLMILAFAGEKSSNDEGLVKLYQP